MHAQAQKESMTGDHQPIKHSVMILITCAIVLVCAAIFNALVDPYLRLEWFRTQGINAARPKAVGQVRMAKAYQVLRQKPKTIVLGNSRVDLGIDPTSEFWPGEMQPVYNAGQPGGGMWANLRYLQHASNEGNVEHALLGCDFFDFLRDQRDRAAPPFSHPNERRLTTTASGDLNTSRWRGQLSDSVYSLLSTSALVDSALTIAGQRQNSVADISPEGLTSGEPFRTIIARQGQHSLIDEKNAEYRLKLDDPNVRLFRENSLQSFEWETLDRLLSFCERKKIQLTVFTHPYHTDILRLIHQSGHWKKLERWKKDLVERCERSNASIRVFDFACVCDVTDEPIPEPQDRKTVMQWYWETGHYRKETGDLILQEIYRTGKTNVESAALVSNRLDSGNIDEHLNRERNRLSLVLSRDER